MLLILTVISVWSFIHFQTRPASLMPKFSESIPRFYTDSMLENCNKTRIDLVAKYKEVTRNIDGSNDGDACLDGMLEVGLLMSENLFVE